MAVVYAAHDAQLNRKVALKVLKPDSVSNVMREQDRLRSEAQAMARLSHPNVVVIHEVGSTGDQVFLAMELVEGMTLRRWLEEKPRGWKEIIPVLVQAGKGLA